MDDILPTLYKFIHATLIKVSMLTREKMLQVEKMMPHVKDNLFHQ